MELNDHLREMLKELGQAINESISGSGRVHDSIQRIRDEGYNLYMVLDAKVGVKKEGRSRKGSGSAQPEPPAETERAAFRINLKDLHFLRSVGIDPTVRVRRRIATTRLRSARGSALTRTGSRSPKPGRPRV